MRRIVLGTAGHIDHGKTSLVKSLTGYDADVLKEEKERGITIALGFTSFTLGSGDELSIVDVPGHEKFIKTMIAGAAGMDMIMLVIAADDGVMPQTREHLDICSLLGVKHGMVALTKCDLVESDWLELVKSDIRKFTAGTFLEAAGVIEVSSVTGDGIDELKETIEATAKKVIEREVSGLARMPVDRIFTMKGFGTVFTGTLISGELNAGDDVDLLPGGRTARIRTLQQHGRKTDTALAGSRVAVNLVSVEKDESLRGELIVRKGAFTSSSVIDVHITNVSADKIAIRNLTSVRFLAYTSRSIAEIRLLTGKRITPGGAGFAQIILDRPLPLVVDDRFILLGTSKIQTLGGGVVLNPKAKILPKKMQAELLAELQAIKDTDTDNRAEIFIKKARLSGISLQELSYILNFKERVLSRGLDKALSNRAIICFDSDNKSYVSSVSFDKAKENILSILDAFHRANPAKTGMVKEELKGKACTRMPEKLLGFALKALAKDEKLTISSELVLLKEHADNVSSLTKEIKADIEEIYKSSGLTPPFLPELKKKLASHDPRHVDDTLTVLIREKTLVRISEGYYLHELNFRRLKDDLVGYLFEHKQVDASAFKEITKASRKYSIPLLEKFDMLGLTIRQPDNTRVLA